MDAAGADSDGHPAVINGVRWAAEPASGRDGADEGPPTMIQSIRSLRPVRDWNCGPPVRPYCTVEASWNPSAASASAPSVFGIVGRPASGPSASPAATGCPMRTACQPGTVGTAYVSAR
jgi:hypothetical protein